MTRYSSPGGTKSTSLGRMPQGNDSAAKRAMSIIAIVFMSCATSIADDFTELPEQVDGAAPKQMLGRYLRGLADEAFARRAAQYETLKTAEQIAAYQTSRRDFFIQQLGGFPERTPLNARVVGKLAGEGYRIEKIIFESQPQHYVTALLYLPESNTEKIPGVIVPCGHTSNGKTGYQHLCILLARNGIAALCYDPIGQGERYQLLDDDGRPLFKSTDEHTLVGVGSILVGRNTASYRVWDGIRALDYLASRQEIDAKRLGCTGNSGGGTLTEYLMAIDDRIVCAAPSCCITTFEARLDTNTVGDAEQNIFGQIAFGFDHADYTLLRAPKPTLLCTATHDFVDIDGAWEIFRETKRLYARLGYSERVDLIEVDGKHGFTRPKREAAVRWMRRWLLNKDDPITESPYTSLPHEKLLCSPQGQVQRIEGARSVIDLNVERMEQLQAQREAIWKGEDHTKTLDRVREIAGIRPLADLTSATVKQHGDIDRDGFTIEKLAIHTEPGIYVPALLYLPKKPNGRRVLYLHDQGKQAVAGDDGTLAKLAGEGVIVLAADVRGIGETSAGSSAMWGGGWNDIFLAYLLGKSTVGMRAEDVLVCASFLTKQQADDDDARVELIAHGLLGPPALHAAALEVELFDKVTLIDAPGSWEAVVRSQVPRGQLANAVHGALEVYDLPDLAARLQAEKRTVRWEE